RELRVGGPDFLAVDYEIIAVFDRTCLQRCEVRPRAGLGISLAPDFLAGKNLGDVPLSLLLRSPMHKGGSHEPHPGADEGQGGVHAREFLMINDGLQDAGAPATVLFGPIDSGTSAGSKLSEPG